MDNVTKETRSRIMRSVHQKDTGPELVVRRLLHALGYRYRLHLSMLPGRPDIVFPGRKKVVFVHGCFWHSHEGCRRATKPSSNKVFWHNRLEGNKRRDAVNIERLEALGWEALVVWECQVKDIQELKRRVTDFLGPQRCRGHKPS